MTETMRTLLAAKQERLLRRPEVEARTGLSRSTLYDWMKRGEFPQPVKLGARIVAWRESDVSEWMESRETRGDGMSAPKELHHDKGTTREN
ncbi:helix-turn-helix transcriptional regulator [Rhodosalinus sp. 5P4]|uniref:helix-turn-helix transcriptional regulator n=1 Tax=Rhodosalinus sp. 5P4 TaxID=3239196 RepID=UPI0035241C27